MTIFTPTHKVNVLFDGQSMFQSPPPPEAVPNWVMHGTGIPWVNVAKGGHGWLDLTADVATRVYPHARKVIGGYDVVLMFGGQGDMWNPLPNGQQDGTVAYQRAVTYRDGLRNAGFDRFIICTCPTAGPDVLGTGRPTPLELERLAEYNRLIISNEGGFDAVVRCDVWPFDDATNEKFFVADRTHLSVHGAKAAAAYIKPALMSVISKLP